jgi:hypothetical protein
MRGSSNERSRLKAERHAHKQVERERKRQAKLAKRTSNAHQGSRPAAHRCLRS